MTSPVEPEAAAPADDWPLLSRLLDEALALPTEARGPWLAGLHGDAARLGPRLAALLAHEADAERRGFLAQPAQFTLPPSAGEDAVGSIPASQHAAGDEIGPWTLLSPLGRGGMAEVWLARRSDGSLQRSVALKLPLPGFADARLAARVLRERHLLASLAHPNIVRLFDAGATEDGRPWLAMEAVDGLPITEWCTEHGASLAQKVGLLLQACDAVQHAHGRLVVHRDIKPSNMLVSADGCVHLLDFGIAKLLRADSALHEGGEADASLTQLGGRPLTPDYASPEQMAGEEPGIATDVYALGVLAYRLFTGVAPHEPADGSRRALEAAIAEQAPRPPSARVEEVALRRALHGDLDTIVLKALKKLPAERYATVDAFAADLRRHLAGEPVQARPDTWAYRASRFVRRNRWAVAGAVVVAMSLAGGIGVALVQARQARAEAVRAQAMYEFMRGLLNRDASSTPDLENRDMTVRELLQRAADRVTDSLADAPRERFRMMRDLSVFLLSAGSRERAVTLLEANLTQATALYGARSAEAAAPMLDLAEYRHEARGDFAGAHALANAARAIYREQGVDDPRQLARADSLTGFYGTRIHAHADPADLALLERAVALLRTIAGDSGLGTTLEVLAISYGERGQPERALAAAIEGVAYSRRVFGENNWKTAAQLEQEAVWLRVLNRSADAERLLREARAIHAHVWPADHFLLARWSKYFAETLAPGDKRAEGRAALIEGLGILALPKWAGNVTVRQNVEEQLLSIELRAGRVDAAARLCAAIAADWPRKMGSSRLAAAERCAAVAIERHEEATAVRLLGEGRAESALRCPGDASCRRWLDLREGDLALAQGRAGAATASYLAVLDSPDTLDLLVRSSAWLGLSMAEPRHPRLAAGGALDAMRTAVDALAPGSATELQALLAEAAGRAAAAAGEPAIAVPLLQQAVDWRERIDDAGGVWLARSRQALASVRSSPP